MSDTPRTDALIRFEFGPTGHHFPAHALLAMMQLARQLERELAEARAECERYRTALLNWLREEIRLIGLESWADGAYEGDE